MSRESREAIADGRGVTTQPAGRFSVRPKANLTSTRLLDTEILIQADTIDRVGLDGAWIHGPLPVRGE